MVKMVNVMCILSVKKGRVLVVRVQECSESGLEWAEWRLGASGTGHWGSNGGHAFLPDPLLTGTLTGLGGSLSTSLLGLQAEIGQPTWGKWASPDAF